MNLAKLWVPAAAVIAAPVFGGLIAGIDRKISARLQGRYGPPILQPFYDLYKLFGKDPLAVNRWQPFFAAMYLFGAAASVAWLALGGDLLVLFFLTTFTVGFLVLGASCVPSPFSRAGAGRELLQALVYEPVLILVFAAIFQQTGRWDAAGVWRQGGVLLAQTPLLYLCLFLVLVIKLRKSPFDFSASPHAHQELVRGVLTEYSGPFLAMVELGHWYETALLLMICALFWSSVPGSAILVAATVAGLIFVDNLFPRLTWRWMMARIWLPLPGLALLNLIWLMV
ncbi:MAG: NADH-quinone oxidoreductase subunit H [Desulfobacterales bacterium]|nr:NADH-quinone oxidoreductase subunit H [Desulfobacterales bacterium]